MGSRVPFLHVSPIFALFPCFRAKFSHVLLFPNHFLLCSRVTIVKSTVFPCSPKTSERPSFTQKYNPLSLSPITLDFSLLLKNHFECSFVSSECSLQSSNVCFEVGSEYFL